MSRAIAAFDVCGCTASISLLDHPADAYAMAADAAKRGFRVEEVEVDDWKARGWHCNDHPDGPPWWKSNGGKGKRPAEYAPQIALPLA